MAPIKGSAPEGGAFDKIDNIEYIDSVTPTDITNINNKGYHTIELGDDDKQKSTASKLSTPREKSKGGRPKTNGGKKKNKRDKPRGGVAGTVFPESSPDDKDENMRPKGRARDGRTPPPKEVVTRVKTSTVDTETTKVVTTTTSLNRYVFTCF